MKSNSVGSISFSWQSTLGFDLISKEISFENQTYTIPRKILYLSGQILDMRIKEWSRCSTLKVTQVYWRHVIAASGAWVESTSFFFMPKNQIKVTVHGSGIGKKNIVYLLLWGWSPMTFGRNSFYFCSAKPDCPIY